MPSHFPHILELDAAMIQALSEIPLCHSQITHTESSPPPCLSLSKVRWSCQGAIILCWGCSTYLCTSALWHSLSGSQLPWLSFSFWHHHIMSREPTQKSECIHCASYWPHTYDVETAQNCLCMFFCLWNWHNTPFYFFSRASLQHLLQVNQAYLAIWYIIGM